MDNYEKNYISQRPQELCLMCGRCCRVAATTTPYEELVKMEDKGAKDFLSIFEPYESIDAAREVDSAIVDNILERFDIKEKIAKDQLTFYRCKYIQDNNLCGKYQDRPVLCKHFPASPWAIVPPGCGFEGWLFLKREEIKQKIRKVKEELIEMELLKRKVQDKETLEKIDTVVKKMHASIEHYAKYGAKDW